MRLPTYTARGAILLGGLVAALLDLAAVFAFWAARDVSPVTILQSIASARLGGGAFDGGIGAALIGLALHFGVSFVFAAAWVIVASRSAAARSRPVVLGLAYGVIAYLVMTFVVVPLSLAEFGSWPPPLLNLAASIGIHLLLFGLPIALIASRMRVEPPATPQYFALSPLGGVLLGGFVAGTLDIAAAFAVWAANDVEPAAILQSIASALLGRAAYTGGASTAALGAGLHFLVSLAFAAAYVGVSSRAGVMRAHPILFGLLFGLVVHWIMSEIVVPLSLAAFGTTPPSAPMYALTLFIHMFLFGLPIAIAASRVRRVAAPDSATTP
jgi:uncharacterized membrane protein YagU involved in acid resistance